MTGATVDVQCALAADDDDTVARHASTMTMEVFGPNKGHNPPPEPHLIPAVPRCLPADEIRRPPLGDLRFSTDAMADELGFAGEVAAG